jgi:hypothetical protein
MLNKAVAIFILLAVGRMLYMRVTGQAELPPGVTEAYKTGQMIGELFFLGLGYLALRELFWKKG